MTVLCVHVVCMCGPIMSFQVFLSYLRHELYILHTNIRLCGTVDLLEFDQKHTHKKKEPMKKTYEPQRKKRKKKKKESNEKKIKKEREVK